MTDPIMRPMRANSVFQQVREKMRVFDRDGKEVGRVKDISFGPATDSVSESPARTGDLAEPLASGAPFADARYNDTGAYDDDNIPDTLRKRLEKQGFIRIDTGLLGSDRFALPDQVASVAEDRVQLTVPESQLIKK